MRNLTNIELLIALVTIIIFFISLFAIKALSAQDPGFELAIIAAVICIGVGIAAAALENRNRDLWTRPVSSRTSVWVITIALVPFLGLLAILFDILASASIEASGQLLLALGLVLPVSLAFVLKGRFVRHHVLGAAAGFVAYLFYVLILLVANLI